MLGVLLKGIKKGIEVVNKIFLLILIVLFLIIVIWVVILDGVMEGLYVFFKLNWSVIGDGKVWIVVYG